MSETEGQDRRRSPRIKGDHPIVLQAGTGDGSSGQLPARSIDINLGGLYCTLEQPLELFAKYLLTISLPLRDSAGHNQYFDLEAQAVVVRAEPEGPGDNGDAFACALAFISLEPESELVLARYLLQNLGA